MSVRGRISCDWEARRGLQREGWHSQDNRQRKHSGCKQRKIARTRVRGDGSLAVGLSKDNNQVMGWVTGEWMRCPRGLKQGGETEGAGLEPAWRASLLRDPGKKEGRRGTRTQTCRAAVGG